MSINYKAAYEAAQKLPLKYQDAIVEKILEQMEQQKWDEWLAWTSGRPGCRKGPTKSLL
jgi:hypothetical protein